MFKRYASASIIEAHLEPETVFHKGQTAVLRRQAHRAVFDYEPRPGFLYVRSRAISSRCNDNYDEFPAAEIKKAYKTFIGKPVFVNHHNDNHRRARGVIIDAALHEDVNPDGSPDTWTEVLMEVDGRTFPKLAKAILAGEIDRTSMGTDVKFSVCSVCKNKATNPAEYCQHIPKMKGQRIYKVMGSSGRREGVLVREICYGLGFFENSLLVEDPADPTAFFTGVDARGFDKSAAKMDPSVAKPADQQDRLEGVTLAKDDKGYFVRTHRARSESYASPSDITDDDVEFIRSTGSLRKQADDDQCPYCSDDGMPEGTGYRCQGCGRWFPEGGMDTDLHRVPGKSQVMSTLSFEDFVSARRQPMTFEAFVSQGAVDFTGTGGYPSWYKRPAPSDREGRAESGALCPDCHHDLERHSNRGGNVMRCGKCSCTTSIGHTASLDAEAAKSKPIKDMNPDELAAHRQAESDADQWHSDHPVHKDNVIAHWHMATEDEKKSGESWYSDAHHMTKAIANDTKTPMHTMAGLMSNYSPQTHWATNMMTAARVARTKTPLGGPGSGVMASTSQRGAAHRLLSGEHYDDVLKAPKTHAFAHLIEHGGNQDADKPKVVVDRHALSVAAGARASDMAYGRSGLSSKKRYQQVADTYHDAAKEISQHEGRKIEAHQVQAVTWTVRQRLNEAHDRALSKTAGSRSASLAKKAVSEWSKYAAEHHPEAYGKAPGTGYSQEPTDVTHERTMEHERSTGTPAPQPKQAAAKPTHGRTCGAVIPGKGMCGKPATKVGEHNKALCGTHGRSAESRGEGVWQMGPDGKQVTSAHLAYGETKAPADVDTLRDEECPVCGESDSYDGTTCQVCGYDAPPQMFRDPDLNMARSIDLRKDVMDGVGGLPGQTQDPNQQDANGGMPDEIPGEEIPGSDSTLDPGLLGPDGQPLGIDANGNPVGPDAAADGAPVDPSMLDANGQPVDLAAGTGRIPQDGDPFTPGPNAPTPEQPLDPDDVEADGSVPDGTDEADPMNPEDLAADGQVPAQEAPDPGTPGDGIADLVCPNCGFESDGAPPQSVDMDDQAAAGGDDETGTVAGGVCPNCQQAQMVSAGDMEQMQQMAQPGPAPRV